MPPSIDSLIPNWAIYRSKFPGDVTTIDAINAYILRLEAEDHLSLVANRLNVEFGILLLRKQEIDTHSRNQLFKLFSR